MRGGRCALARTPGRGRARDRRRFRQPGVATFRRRPCLSSKTSCTSTPTRACRACCATARTALFTGDLWNVRHICTTADSNDRVGVAARVGPPGIALSVPVSLTPVKTHDGRGSVPASAQRSRRSNATRCLPSSRWSCSSPGETGHGSVGLEPQRRRQRACRGCGRCCLGACRGRQSPGCHDARRHIVPNALSPLRRQRNRRPWPDPGCCKWIVSGGNPIVVFPQYGV